MIDGLTLQARTVRPYQRLFLVLFFFAAALLIWAVDGPPEPFKPGDYPEKDVAKSASSFREIQWEELIPPGWRPADAFKGLDLARMRDSDPRAMDALARMRDVWDNAPVVSSMEGTAVRIAGFIIPLERIGDEVSEFLLVPYFGACIHAPPPPGNQIIYVFADKPLKNVQTMDALWVSGTLKLTASDSPWGRSAYRMQAETTMRYPLPTLR